MAWYALMPYKNVIESPFALQSRPVRPKMCGVQCNMEKMILQLKFWIWDGFPTVEQILRGRTFQNLKIKADKLAPGIK